MSDVSAHLGRILLLPESLERLLQLPPSYHIRSLLYDTGNHRFALIVESADLPEVPEGAPLNQVDLAYEERASDEVGSSWRRRTDVLVTKAWENWVPLTDEQLLALL